MNLTQETNEMRRIDNGNHIIDHDKQLVLVNLEDFDTFAPVMRQEYPNYRIEGAILR